MSNRSMLEINHDHTPHTEEGLIEWARQMKHYLNSGDPRVLPQGVTFFKSRHHTEPCPMGKPPKGWDNSQNHDTNDQPPWIKCGERMPPDDDTEVIIRHLDRNGEIIDQTKSEGQIIHAAAAFTAKAYGGQKKINAVWTPYTPELWKELNT